MILNDSNLRIRAFESHIIEEVQGLFLSLDSDRDNLISLTEFSAALALQEETDGLISPEELLSSVFTELDTKGDNGLS